MSVQTTTIHTEHGPITAIDTLPPGTSVLVRDKVERTAREIASWVADVRNRGDFHRRIAYTAPENPYAQMQIAKSAVDNDDIVGGVCDVTEGLIFQGMKWESEDSEAADLFNQLSRDLNLDELARQWHREEFTYSQVVVGLWWGQKQYTPRAKTDQGKQSKKKVELQVPLAWTFLDPSRVVPLKPGPFGQDRLAWHATREEYAIAMASRDNVYGDPVLRAFTNGPVTITDPDEERALGDYGIDTKRLLALNPSSVFRHCRTKMSYERFPTLRLKSTFALLDLKQQLIEADRVSLVGAANYLLLVRQGSDQQPAQQEEIDNLKENFKVVAKLPVIVGDHRLQIDIITPAQEHVLDSSKYDTIDRRLLNRTLGALSIGGTGQRNESTLTIARGVARLLETRRHMMKRTIEEKIARAIVEHPANASKFKHEPNLTFTPRNVQLDADSEVTKSILTLRTMNEISRETALEFFGLDQAVEALRREFEEENYDDIFKTQVPFSAAGDNPNADGQDPKSTEPSQVSGARGGRPKGGGESTQSVQGQAGGRTAGGNKSTGGK